MRTYQILYDPEYNGGRGEAYAHQLDAVFPEDELVYRDYSLMANALDMFSFLSGDDCLIVCGGADTLLRFRSETEGVTFDNEVKFLSPENAGRDGVRSGSVSDQLRSVSELLFVKAGGASRILGKRLTFGADAAGPVSDFRRVMGYKPLDAFVGADGSGNNFGRIWLLSVSPCEGGAELECWHGFGRLRALKIVPAIMKGRAEKYCDNRFGVKAKRITVELDRPADIVVDGETIGEVGSFTVTAG